MTDKTDLAALLGSRICHDLISPIGAISNGVELLMMEGGPVSPELALIAESVAAAKARIGFFRIAFGPPTGEQRLAQTEIAKIIAETSQGARVTIEWAPIEPTSRAAAKLAFLAILCCDSALAFGGRITVSHTDGKWHAIAQAERLRIEPDLWDSLSNPTLNLTPAQVHFALFAREISQQNRRLMTEITKTELRLTF